MVAVGVADSVNPVIGRPITLVGPVQFLPGSILWLYHASGEVKLAHSADAIKKVKYIVNITII